MSCNDSKLSNVMAASDGVDAYVRQVYNKFEMYHNTLAIKMLGS